MNSSSNSSSNSSNPPLLSTFNFPPIAQNKPLNYVEFGVRVYDFLVHLVYFLYIALKKNTEFRSRTYLHLHNINVVTMLISIMYLAYTPNSVPSFSNQSVNMILCTMTELMWSFLKYARVLSLLLIAIYRYIGCFYVRLYKRFNSRLSYLLGSIAVCWLISVILPISFKYALSTQFSIYFCIDGYAPGRMAYSIGYYILNTTLSSIIPTIAIFVIYRKIYSKLKDQASKTNTNVDKSSKLAKFSRQFIVINFFTVLATVFATFVDFVNVIAAYPSLNYLQTEFQYIRPIFRSVMLIFQSFIPIVSMYYSVWTWNSFKCWFYRSTRTRSSSISP